MKKIFFLLLIQLVLILTSIPAYASEPVKAPEIAGKSAILIERTTGTVLYEKNADAKSFPASTTKILTAIVMLDYITMDEIITIGDEITHMPEGSSRAGHFQGESISGHNLLRGLMLPSGNESGCVVAAEIAKRVTGDNNISYEQAEKLFAVLLNEKAAELGATNTHFVNPHGFHAENHYTTARDMAIILNAALKIPEYAEVTKETSYTGASIEGDFPSDLSVKDYNWKTTNKLLEIGSEYYYSYATGGKTGFTTPAGNCLASSAEKEGIELIAIIYHSEEGQRFTDSIDLYEYGFDNFNFMEVQQENTVIENVRLFNPRLGETDNMDVYVKGEYTGFFSREKFRRLISEVVFEPEFIYTPTEEEILEAKENGIDLNDGKTLIKLPIEKGTVIAHISYSIDGEEVFKDDIVTSESALERTKESDKEYYINYIKENMFTTAAIPYWAGLIVIILVILLIIVLLIRAVIVRRRDVYRYSRRRRRY